MPLIYVLGALSFNDARSRGSSELEYLEKDEWRFGDMLARLLFERSGVVFDADYVRGRMMKTTVTVASDGKLVVETRNRHEMALRWLEALKGKKHLRLVERAETPATSGE